MTDEAISPLLSLNSPALCCVAANRAAGQGIGDPFRGAGIGIVLVSSGGAPMKLFRRQFLHLAAGAAALPAVSRIARAQTYPTRPVRWMVGTAAGASPDIVARIMGQWLSEHLSQPLIIENRPGAGTNIAVQAVVRAPPDGYSLLFITSANAINATLYENLSFNFIRDIAPVASIMRGPLIAVVNPSVPFKTVPELIAYAKANPGKISMASNSNGTVSHVAGELFKMMTGTDMLHVAYRSEPPALTDLIGGQVQVMFDNIPGVIELIKAGKLRALAITTARRWEALPELPTVDSFVPGYEASATFGVGVPKGTPTEIIERLNKEINSALADPKMKAQIAELGATPLAGSPSDYGNLIVDETEKWGKVVKFSDAKPD
jgi:tripartite-type tricarboxylate transporter receptor subunit TctC